MATAKKTVPVKRKRITAKIVKTVTKPVFKKAAKILTPLKKVPAATQKPPTPLLSKQEKAGEEKSKLRIRVRAYDHKILDISIKQIVETVLRSGAEISGPIPLPTEIRKYTVNRSSFVHKDAREQFEMRIHKRLIDILNPQPKIIDALTNLNLPAGVDIEVKTS